MQAHSTPLKGSSNVQAKATKTQLRTANLWLGLLIVVAQVAFTATTWMNWFSWYSGGDSTNYQTAWNLPHLDVSVPKASAVLLLHTLVDLALITARRSRLRLVSSIVLFIASVWFTFLMYLTCFTAAEIDQYDRLLGARLGLTLAVVALGAATARVAVLWRLSRFTQLGCALPRR